MLSRSLYSDGEDYSFLYDAFGQSEFTDLVSIYIPELSDAVFNSWEEFEYCCDDIESGLIWRLVDEEELADGDLGAAPREYFGSKSTVEQKVIEAEQTMAHLCGCLCWSVTALAQANEQYDKALELIEKKFDLRSLIH